MRTRASIALLVPLACLLGCTLPTTIPASTNSPSSLLSGNWSNWQIQTGSAITSPPTGTYLTGALQAQGSQITGTFITNYASSGTSGVVNMAGSYNAATGDLAFTNTPGYLAVDLTETSDPTTVATGNLALGCIPVNGVACNVIRLAPGVGVQIAPLNGIYTGTLAESASTLTSPIPSGTVSLALTQSATPNTTGSFPLTGTLTFTGGGCTINPISFSSTISGISIPSVNLIPPSPSQAILPTPAYIIAYTNPTASQITVTGLTFYPSPCNTASSSSSSYTGTLNLQQ